MESAFDFDDIEEFDRFDDGAGESDGGDGAPDYAPFPTSAWRAEQVRAMERPLLDRGVPLMRMAADAAAHVAQAMLARQPDGPQIGDAHILLLAGAGDNGGDGLFAAAALAKLGASVQCVAVGRSLHEEGLAALREAGGSVIALDPQAAIPGAESPVDEDDEEDLLGHVLDLYEASDLVLDAMTGIGVAGALRGPAARLANEIAADRTDPHAPARPLGEPAAQYPLVLAVDVPSGIGVDDGTLPGACIPADVTVMFGALKPCALLPPAAMLCGQIVLVDFGFDVSRAPAAVEAMSGHGAADHVRAPRVSDDKYARGVVGLVTGSDSYPGAAVLSSTAAALSGVGMVRYVGPDRASRMVLDRMPEAVLGEGRCQAWVVGSGVPDGDHASPDDPQREAIRQLLEPYAVGEAHWPSPETLTTIGLDELPDSLEDLLALLSPTFDDGQESLPPVVVDAGALDLLPEHVPPQVVITPHAGELARLLRVRGEAVDADDVTRDPLGAALAAWHLTGATVLLKGAVTVVVGSDGPDKPRVVVSGNAPAWLATAGSGDVLAGTIGALLAQNAADRKPVTVMAADIAAAGAFLHGLAGQIASSSVQCARPAPILYDEDPDRLADLMAPTGQQTGGAMPFGATGRPVLAGDVAVHLPHAFALLASLATEGGEAGE